METIEVEFVPAKGTVIHARLTTLKVASLARTLGGVPTHKAQHFCLVVHPWPLLLESPVLQLHRPCYRRSQPGFIDNAAAAAGARPARCTPTRRASSTGVPGTWGGRTPWPSDAPWIVTCTRSWLEAQREP
ncbi:hypothetical protein PC129_g5134 [Phytophthora cactorum]|uniref:Uncharacterized protein n=1 Tax=Phytophthora cactorum TaxID=29920 RepID=A0A329R868_9STRA|nr:hypothetical protein Pcac1_g21073 [Phytophthora cactorum]KAG2794273.1 hypothetical protein PC111_g22674 [Phytophthora cactorum]KAG2809654.1 hypothetical protein PC112_g16412 [Phytophthora cactorum]KAG2865227.1 hypothetical protein PC113_g3900 [Phytophthora cactorum]KAG2887406.1 hypothetical protein PC115_g20355 [Phytophthora cactorum]